MNASCDTQPTPPRDDSSESRMSTPSSWIGRCYPPGENQRWQIFKEASIYCAHPLSPPTTPDRLCLP